MTDAEAFRLWRWPEGKPPNIIDAVPALIRKAAMQTMYSPRRPTDTGDVIAMTPRAA